MNNTFEISRFWHLLKKDILEHKKTNIMSFVIILGALAILFCFYSYNTYNDYIDSAESTQRLIYRLNQNLLQTSLFLFVVFGVIASSTLMQSMTTKVKRIACLMTPASQLEKYLSRWLQVTILYMVMFSVALFAADLIRVAVMNVLYSNINIPFLDLSMLVADVHADFDTNVLFPTWLFVVLSLFYFAVQSFFILGSTIWPAKSFLKTFTALILLMVVFIFIARLAIGIFFTDVNDFFSYTFSSSLDVSRNTMATVMGIGFGIIAIFNWVLAYFRFRESEIVEKW